MVKEMKERWMERKKEGTDEGKKGRLKEERKE